MTDAWRQFSDELIKLAQTATDAGEFARVGYQAPDGRYIMVDPQNPMYVWVRIGGDPRYPARANNIQGVAPSPDLPVMVGFPPGKRELYVLGLAAEATAYYDGRLPGNVGLHTHEVGSLWDPVSARRLKMGRVKAHQVNGVYGMKVWIEPHFHAGGWWPGGAIDLTDYVPDSAGFHRWVKVGMDEDANQPVAYPGDLAPKALPLTEEQLAAVPFPAGVAYAGVKLVYGDTAVDQESRFADCTPWRSRGGAGSSTFIGLGDTPTGYGDPGDLVVVNATRTGLEFAAPGGAGAWNPNLPPASPSAWDDEFNNSSVDVKWTKDDPNNKLTVTESGSTITLALAEDNGAGAGLWQTAPTGDWQMVVKIAPTVTGDFPSEFYTNTKIGVAVEFSDGAVCTLTHGHFFPNDPPYFMKKPSVSLLVNGGGFTVAQFIDIPEFYLRLRYDSATEVFSGQYSVDGSTWSEKTVSTGRTVSKIGLYAENNSEASENHVVEADYDFFRLREEYGASDDPIYGNTDTPLTFDATQIGYTPDEPGDWDDPDPATVQAALDDLAARPSGAALTVKEADGTPSVAGVDTIVVTNGTLTDDGGGQITLDFGSAATDSAAIHDDVSGEIAAITEKTTPVAADMLLIEDSEASNAKKMVQIGNLPGGGGTPAFSGAQVSRTDQPTASVSSYVIPWNVARFDTDTYWGAGQPTRLTAPQTGYYRIGFHVALQDAADSDGYMVAVVNRTMANFAAFVPIADKQMSHAGDNTGPTLQGSGVWHLEASDYIELGITHFNATGNKIVECGLTMTYLGN